ncbi:MAG: hypothetical protein AAF688_09440 [Bacteroidota bacterium]
MRKQLKSIFNYYKPLSFWSLLVTMGIIMVQPNLILALSTKLFLTFVLWMMLSDRKVRQRLRFYKISGVSNFKFFSTLFLFDSLLTVAIIVGVKGFI